MRSSEFGARERCIDNRVNRKCIRSGNYSHYLQCGWDLHHSACKLGGCRRRCGFYQFKLLDLWWSGDSCNCSDCDDESQMSYFPRLALGDATAATIESSVGSSLLAAAPLSGPAAPFVALAGSIAELLAKFTNGCGQPCLLSTEYANQAEALLQQNIATYFCPPDGDCSDFSITTPRSQTAQAAAMQN